jgi:hypothetical protein
LSSCWFFFAQLCSLEESMTNKEIEWLLRITSVEVGLVLREAEEVEQTLLRWDRDRTAMLIIDGEESTALSRDLARVKHHAPRNVCTIIPFPTTRSAARRHPRGGSRV